MTVSLPKGGNLSLTRSQPGIAGVIACLGWKVNTIAVDFTLSPPQAESVVFVV